MMMGSEDVIWEIRFATVSVNGLDRILRQIRDIARRYSVYIVCFNADSLTGPRHVTSAVSQAVRAARSGEMIANSFEMEALLYAAGSRQCSVAASFGIHEGENRLYVCCCPAPTAIWDDLARLFNFIDDQIKPVSDPDKKLRLMSLFGITEEELEAAGTGRLEDLVLERVALLAVNR
jgi:KEOPS complex subunit Cgi121